MSKYFNVIFAKFFLFFSSLWTLGGFSVAIRQCFLAAVFPRFKHLSSDYMRYFTFSKL